MSASAPTRLAPNHGSPEPKRLVVCSNTSWYLFNFRLTLIDALKKAGHEVCSAAPRDAYSTRLSRHVTAHYDLNFSSSNLNPLTELRTLLKFRHMLVALKADVLLSFTPKPNIYGGIAAATTRTRVINNVAGLGSGFVGRGTYLPALLRGLYRVALSRSDFLFFQNPEDHRLFLEGGIAREENSLVIPGSGVDLTRFAHHPMPQPDAGPCHFLFVARMLRAKGVLEFLEAARRIESEFPGRARFTLCGSFDIDNSDAVPKSVIEKFSDCPSIVFAGHVDDILPYLRDSHCVVLPSYYREGVPRSLLEALAIGRPIITTDMPGCRETLNGHNGLVVPPRDVHSLYEAMTELMNLTPVELHTMGTASRRHAEERFDENIVINAYLQRVAALNVEGSSGGRAKHQTSPQRRPTP